MPGLRAPRVNVIIATYNYSAALRCAIQSVLAQRFTDFELLVIGDGCTDDSAEVAASFKDPRVRWHKPGVELRVSIGAEQCGVGKGSRKVLGLSGA